MVCSNCQFEHNPPGARFCAGCGTPLPTFCTVCGAALLPGGRFCAQCGTPVGGEAAPVGPPAVQATPQAPALLSSLPPPTIPAEPPATAAETVSTATSAERRLVTILFADIVGSTSVGEAMDPEDLTDMINGAFGVMTRAVSDAGGHIARLMGDGLLAFFGAPVSHEDDPLRAVRAALGIKDGVIAFGERLAADGGPKISVRVGVDSGLVVVGQVGSDLFSEYTTMGDAANTAARLQGAASPGEVFVSEETARLIRGAVELETVGPLALKGKAEPVPAYRVTGPPPKVGVSLRGLPGVTTPLVGREGERTRLAGMLEDACSSGRGAWATLTGEGGVGKSRLMATFLADAAEREPGLLLLRARSMEQDNDAYGLVRSLLVTRYAADAGDGTGGARAKVEAGIAADLGGNSRTADASGSSRIPDSGSSSRTLDPARAARDLVQLVMPDRSAADSGDPRGLAERALAALETLVRTLAGRVPVLILALEDLHWSDDASLDAVARVAEALRGSPALVLGNARPALFVRRPLWGEGESHHIRIDLTPLSAAATGRLMDALLEGDDPIPEELAQFITERSEGNPYYVEEFVRMLLSRGILERGAAGWTVNQVELEEGRVPRTLQGMLQARLDSLDPPEKDAIQRASVLGRVFWSGALAALGVTTPGVLDTLRGRGHLFARERSTFPHEREFVFKHALLRDAAYASLLKKARPPLHAAAADWLLAAAGDRYGEFAAQIGGHAEAAGRKPDAATHYRAAAERALAAYANADAIEYFTKALDLWPDDDAAGKFASLKGRESALDLRGEREAQEKDLEAMARLAKGMDGVAQSYVHFRKSWFAHRTGDNETAERDARKALKAAGDDRASQANAMVNLGNALVELKRFSDASASFGHALAIREEMNDTRGAATAVLGQASANMLAGEFVSARAGFEQALAIYRQLDDPSGQAVTCTNLAITLATADDLEGAAPFFEDALDLYRSAGDRSGEGKALHNLGFLAGQQENHASAEAYLREALGLYREVSDRSGEIETLKDLADVLRAANRSKEADTFLAQANGVTGDS